MTYRMHIYQGRPCRHGHAGLRYRKGYECIECVKARVLRQRQSGARKVYEQSYRDSIRPDA